MLSVNHLTRTGQYADISLDIRAGEIVGLTGLLGSGRTEFALSLFGMNEPTSGEIRLNGKPLALKTNAQAIDEGIAYVSEDRLNLGLVLEQPISSNILVTVLDKLPNRLGLVAEARRQRTARKWIEDPGDQGARSGERKCARSRAATSSASCWPSGWQRTRSS